MTRLWPSDSDLLGQLTPLAARLTAATQSLRHFFAEPADRRGDSAAIDDQQQQAKALMHDLLVRLDRTFISSFDPEDIHRIATGIGAVIDVIAGTARRAVSFRVAEVREPTVRLAELLARSAEHLETAVSLLAERKQAQVHCIELKRFEEEGDGVYYDGLTKLFAEEPEVIELLKWKELYDRLEEAQDRSARVAHLLESITLKP